MLGSKGGPGSVSRCPGSAVRGPGLDAESKHGRGYRDLIAWRVAMQLVTEVYAVSKCWPREEIYGLTSQVRRAAVSIPSNIAEGRGRQSVNEFRNFLSIAYGSLMELETQIQIGFNLGYQSEEQTSNLLVLTSRVGQLINGLSNSLSSVQVSQSGKDEIREESEEYNIEVSFLDTTLPAETPSGQRTPDSGPRTADSAPTGGPQCV